MANMAKIEDKLKILPALPGCYLMKNKDGDIIYVGKAKKLKNRVRQYFVGAHDFKTTRLVSNIDDFEYIVTSSEKEALLLEINLIKKHTPPYNIMFMDDKSYPYLKLTKENAPVLKVVRNTKDRKAYYFGPFPDSGAAWETAKLLNRIYPLRKCRRMPKKECLYYHMGQCLAPCIREIDERVYADMVSGIQKFMRGDVRDMLDTLQREMEQASEELLFEKAQEKLSLIHAIEHVTAKQQIDFKDRKDRDVFGYYVDKGYISIQGFFLRGGKLLERTLSIEPLYENEADAFVSFILQYYANNPLPQEILIPKEYDITHLEEILDTKILQPLRGDKLKLVDMVLANAKNAHEQKFELVERKESRRYEGMEQLCNLLQKEIHRIELFDNSHISGTHNVSGMVVYRDGEPSKKDYRTFRLGEYISDLDSMKEVIYRRYFRLLKEGARFPDLLIVDGGYLQIEAAREIIEALDIPLTICGLVKDDNHRTSNLMDVNGNILPVKRDSSLFFLLTQMQDEVHRFAISYHRKLRGKAMTKSILDEVEGIGEVRKKEIWKHFKSLKRLKEATIEEIRQVVPEKVAQNIYNILHNTDQKSEDA
ncbi:excinuclease ABC subunit UvrC [[Clostridium] innocuum]|uniref:excinuclease ABC subunit UvrC n=1 Tax=Clostridium innocuum TaxID=1522 RepID=UPI000D6C9B9D|nr:excinuclease ABC subunit UvrC [[Clostridium] innocuum]MBS5682821.1 excinuclease ABC subunit UvrC [[Clostridium] innocuum]MCR0610012.1 excinuclease ABC subunit UvrC [[Clostridium] innocuum]PWJ18812.1 excinuclease ABC subunit C [[Clostridium] innocuum]SSA39585.1 Excinuclease ABC subunit C [[Clostridium] innocuum]